MTGATMPPVPNRPGTPRRSIRIPDELWNEARALAAEQGLDVSDVLRRDLERHVKRWRKTRDTRDTK